MTPTERETWARALPHAGLKCDGRVVRISIPNRSSIEAGITNSEVLGGVRSIPLSAFDYQPSAPDQRVLDLAAQIDDSGEINPLIIAIDSKGPYVIEGGHRLDALFHLGAKDLPALIVLDMDELANDDVAPAPSTDITYAGLLAKLKAMQSAVEVAKANTTNQVNDILQRQRELEGVKAAIRDPVTGTIYTGGTHQRAIDSVPKQDESGIWGRLTREWDRTTENVGFIDPEGKYISRNDAETRWNVLTMEDVRNIIRKPSAGVKSSRRPR